MRKLITLVCLFSALAIYAQDILQFPDDYFGIYKGDLHITNSRGEQTIQMEFHLQATDSVGNYKYVLVYIADGNRQERHYNLIDKGNGAYVVDENNGILLEATLIDNKLYSMFEVQGNILTTTETFYKDKMVFETTFSNREQKKTTGIEGGVKVHTYPITTVQKAVLFKTEN